MGSGPRALIEIQGFSTKKFTSVFNGARALLLGAKVEARMQLEQARAKAQVAANDRGYAISICKLNPYSNEVVLRQWLPRDESRWYFVEKVEVRHVSSKA